jgi:endonuclease/exonuclease/phosphatase family metal-dependent hydrolase
VRATILGYAATLTLLFVAMEFIGERLWPLAVLLYLPQRMFLLPLIILVPAALLVEVSLGTYVMLAWCVIIFLWHVPFFPGIGGSPGPLTMKVITNNYGQNHGQSIQPFISAEDPDFTVLEDASGLGPAFQRGNPQRTVRAIGQFVLIGKTPVTSETLLDWPRWRGAPVAAIFDVRWQGEDVALYAVHLPTPRGDFAKLAGIGLLKELAGRNERRSDDMSFAGSMTARVQLARDFASVLARERRPFVALGDFNMPSDGYVHHTIAAGLTDCFEQAGFGFGFTFPCDTSNPLTLGGPWLRLDYILAGPGWHAWECRVEPARRSQHRAVVATLVRN